VVRRCKLKSVTGWLAVAGKRQAAGGTLMPQV